MSESLKEKAKSASEIQDYTVQFFDKIRNAKNPEKAREEWMTICDKKEWVRLEDAEQTLAELKQKLQQLKDLFSCFIEHIPKHERDVNASYANFIWKIDRKFEELLKEEKAKPT